MIKVAVAKEGNQVSGHFGHCAGFEVFDIENNRIMERTFLPSPGHTPGALPVFLAQHNVNTIIAGGMGARAQELFNDNGISVIVGATGLIETVVTDFISGNIKSSGSVCQEHGHAGSCGEH